MEQLLSRWCPLGYGWEKVKQLNLSTRFGSHGQREDICDSSIEVKVISILLSLPSTYHFKDLTRDEVLNDLIVSGSNERSKLKYLQKCGTKKWKKKVKLQDEMSYNTWTNSAGTKNDLT